MFRASIVERMPVLVSNQPANTNNTEQVYDREEQSSNDRQITNHVSSNEPVVRE